MTGDLQRDGWELGDAEEEHRRCPETFLIPSAEERGNLAVGARVKLLFRLRVDGAQGPARDPAVRVERMWVTVTEKANGTYRGRLESLPVTSNVLKPGDLIEFEPRHVAAVLIRKDDPRWRLHQAVYSGDAKEAASLLKAGADVNDKGPDGGTPLHLACENHSVRIASMLINAGAEIDPRDAWGNTPLSKAVYSSRGRGDLIRLLREKGADPYATNRKGVSPISLARTIANYDVAQYFSDLPACPPPRGEQER